MVRNRKGKNKNSEGLHWPWKHPHTMIPMVELDKLAAECAARARAKMGIGKLFLLRAVVLGTVMQGVLNEAELVANVPLPEILPFKLPGSSVAGHKTVLEVRKVGDKHIVVCRGRVHYNEVLDQRKATFMMRILYALGVREVILTNAAGALNPAFNIGDFVFLEGSFRYEHPDPMFAIWPRPGEVMFYDPSQAFDPTLREKLMLLMMEQSLNPHEGDLSLITGPGYEDKGQRRFLAQFADVAGMSTANEAVVAAHLGMRVAAISMATDECKPGVEIRHVDVVEASKMAQEPLDLLLTAYYYNPYPIIDRE